MLKNKTVETISSETRKGTFNDYNETLMIRKSYKLTPEHREKIRQVMLGRKHTWGNKISKSKMGHVVSEKTRKKLSEINRKNPSKGFKGYKHSKESNEKNKDSHLGKIPWNKGKSKRSLKLVIRACVKYYQWRSNVFQRDNWICQTCFKRGGYLHPHHIRPFSLILKNNKIETLIQAEECWELWDVDNGITLCVECHKLTDSYGKNHKMKV